MKHIIWLCLVVLAGWQLYGDDGFSYGHISFTEEGVQVLRADGRRDAAIVNLPIAPGDQIMTSSEGRVEFQFNNGTIIRLDRDTQLEVTTILAKTLSSSWKVTTLFLKKGRLYAMNQSYNLEMFQVLTPVTAVNLKSSSTTLIDVDQSGATEVVSLRGTPEVLYEDPTRQMQVETVRRNSPIRVTTSKTAETSRGDINTEFLLWNEQINRSFEEMHDGISKLPPPLKRYPPSIIKWAEKWSNLYGEWVYDEMFGYVWSPYQEYFIDKRPFFHASYTTVNNRLFVIPKEPWGWIPAYLGTWHWLPKKGWVWIPGNAFNPVESAFPFQACWMYPYSIGGLSVLYPYSWAFWYWNNQWNYPYYNPPSGPINNPPSDPVPPPVKPPKMPKGVITVNQVIDGVYGSRELYRIYRSEGKKRWQAELEKKLDLSPEMAKAFADRSTQLAKEMQHIVGILEKTPIEVITEKIASQYPDYQPMETQFILEFKSNSPEIVKSERFVHNPQVSRTDWNPDIRMALYYQTPIYYNSKQNEMVGPMLGVRSGNLQPEMQRFIVRELAGQRMDGISSGSRNYERNTFSNSDAGSSSSSSSASTSSGSREAATGSNSARSKND